MKSENSAWDYFDRLYCISLREREDRRQSAREEFAKVGLANRVDFVVVERYAYDVMQQIYESHMLCLQKGLEAGARNIVVFEDDVGFEGFDPRRLQSCVEYLKQNPSWKVFLFGALIRASRKTENPSVQKVRYQSLTHAYALNRDYAQTLAYVPWQGIANDTLFRPLKDGVYAAYPMFAFQKDFSSDNLEYLRLERFRKLLGGLKRIQKGIEFYRRHMFSIYAVQTVFILLVVIYLFYC
ncbi:MAG TPA: hypothetical protein P5294_09295 [Smithellaceae bacterium]|nr:hypothetical protein [Smithellaceae bacterium]HRS88711.1 hypothetical protein [Smithellaceae bacterium]HRV26723.1 hypothetical protein [Smithellaceae bacterium]